MKKIIILLSSLYLLTACAGLNDKDVKNDPVWSKKVNISQEAYLNGMSRLDLKEFTTNNLLSVQLRMTNSHNISIPLNVKITWFDKDGVLVESQLGTMNAFTILGNSLGVFTLIAPNERAKDYYLEIFYAGSLTKSAN